MTVTCRCLIATVKDANNVCLVCYRPKFLTNRDPGDETDAQDVDTFINEVLSGR